LFEHGSCAAATLRALGYPSRGTLATWIEELCPEIRKRIVGRAVGSVPKSQKVKQAAVIELCTREQSARVVAEKASVSRPTLYNWKNQLLGREVPASMKRKKKPASDHERAEVEQQVESLRRDIRQLQLEHDILEKANELIKKGPGINPQLLSNREKTLLVDVGVQNWREWTKSGGASSGLNCSS
jgi:transposase-like protein